MKTFEAKKQWIDSEGESNLIEIIISHINGVYYSEYKIDNQYLHISSESKYALTGDIYSFFNIPESEYGKLEDIVLKYKKDKSKFNISNTIKQLKIRNMGADTHYYWLAYYLLWVAPRINNYKKDGKRYQDIYCGLDELINCDWFEQFIAQYRKEVFNNFKVLLTRVLDDIRKEYKLPREI